MKVSVSPGHNINGTLILPLFEGSEGVPESLQEGLHTALKGQINRILSEGDFKGKNKTTMSIIGSEGGKAMLVGLGKEDDADVHALNEDRFTALHIGTTSSSRISVAILLLIPTVGSNIY